MLFLGLLERDMQRATSEVTLHMPSAKKYMRCNFHALVFID
jgi:hypothetical protein